MILLAAVMVAACAGGGGGAKKTAQAKKFKLPDVPTVLSDPTDRANFLVGFYWESFDFADTAATHSREFTEEIFPNYVGFLNIAAPAHAGASIKELLGKLEADTATYNLFTRELDSYLGDPNSPMRNENIYIPLLEQMSTSPAVELYERIRIKDKLLLTLKNRPGDTAADFVYTLASGRTGRMSDLRNDWLILFFNNPGCPACRDIMDELAQSPVIEDMIAAGKLQVLAVYPDEDLTEWVKYGESFPRTWIYGRDASQTIRDEELYDLRAIPTVYLLDKNKQVVFKDVMDVRQIIYFLAQQ